jgi:hypothetical protein
MPVSYETTIGGRKIAAVVWNKEKRPMNQVTRLKAGMLAATTETIELNDVETDLEKARFDHQAKLFALQQEFNGKRDRLRHEYHERVQEITGCDICGKIAVLCHTCHYGIETFACAECHGYPADEFDYLLDENNHRLARDASLEEQ